LETGENRLLSEGSGPVFSPDSKSIIFRKGRDLHQLGLGENETSSPVFKARGSIISYAFSPDGRWISFVSHRSTHSYVGLWDRQNAKLTYPETSLDHDSYPSWSPDGKSLAYLRIPNVTNKLPFTAHREANPWSIRILDLESMKAKEVWAADPGDGSVVVRDLPAEADRLWWTADGSLIFPWEKTGWVQLYALDTKDGELTHLTQGPGFVEKVNTSFTKKELLLTSNIGDIERRNIYSLDLESLEMVDLSEKELSTGLLFVWKMVLPIFLPRLPDQRGHIFGEMTALSHLQKSSSLRTSQKHLSNHLAWIFKRKTGSNHSPAFPSSKP